MHRSVTHNLGKTLLFVLAVVSNIAVAEIYKWVDAQGNVHFGDKPGDAQTADKAEKVNVVESYQPTARTPEEQKAFDEQQHKEKLRDEMRTRDEQMAKTEAKTRHDQEREDACDNYTQEIDALETVEVKNGQRHVVYATDDQGKPLSSDDQRKKIADLKEQRAKAGCK